MRCMPLGAYMQVTLFESIAKESIVLCVRMQNQVFVRSLNILLVAMTKKRNFGLINTFSY